MPWPFNFPLKAKPRDLDQFKEVVRDCRVRICLDSALPSEAKFSLIQCCKRKSMRNFHGLRSPVIITISAIHFPSNIISSPILQWTLRCLCERQKDSSWINNPVPWYTDFQHYKGKRKVKTKLLLLPKWVLPISLYTEIVLLYVAFLLNQPFFFFKANWPFSIKIHLSTPPTPIALVSLSYLPYPLE